jgi:hypothetical protein
VGRSVAGSAVDSNKNKSDPIGLSACDSEGSRRDANSAFSR